MKKYLPETLLMLNTIIWGATFVIIKSALTDISPLLFISVRFLFATIILFPFAFKIFRTINKEAFWGGLLLGLLYFIGFSTQTIGLNYTTATKSAFITGTFIIFTPLFQTLIERKPPSRGVTIGVVLAVLGLVFLTSKGDSLLSVFTEINESFNIGDFFTLICAIVFSLYLVYLDIISKKSDYKPLVFLQISVTGVCGILFSLLFTVWEVEKIHFNFSSNLLFAILYTSVLATVITTTIQTMYQKFVTPSVAGIILSFEPIFAALFAFFMLNEKISNFGLIGCPLNFCGLLISEIYKKK
ncbi:MAG: DMT family transporter [Ignavibacteria bacterium]|nr:DMT family transporter [Ignavibacteria bacterium]